MGLDVENEFNIRTARNDIKRWIKAYMRTNSRYPACVKMRCLMWPPLHRQHWKYFVEVSVNGKIPEFGQTRVTVDVWDELTYDRKLRRENYENIEFVFLIYFEPNVSNSI